MYTLSRSTSLSSVALACARVLPADPPFCVQDNGDALRLDCEIGRTAGTGEQSGHD